MVKMVLRWSLSGLSLGCPIELGSGEFLAFQPLKIFVVLFLSSFYGVAGDMVKLEDCYSTMMELTLPETMSAWFTG